MKRITRFYFRVCITGIMLTVLFSGTIIAYGFGNTAGLETLAGIGGRGLENGSGDNSRFAFPLGMDVRKGTAIIADTENNLVRSYHGNRTVTYAGRVTGRDSYGAAFGGYVDSSYGRTQFNKPSDCAWLPDGRVIIADRDNNAIRVAGKNWVYTLNGTGESGYKEGRPGEAEFSTPSGIAADSVGNIYVADTGNHCIRKISSNGTTSLVAGTPEQGGFNDGDCKEALFMEPASIAVAEDGSLYVADAGNQRIRRIADGQVTTLTGGSQATYLDTEYKMPGFVDGAAQEAKFWFPEGICMAGPVVIVADTGNHAIRAVAPSGRVQVIAGTGEAGFQDGPPLEGVLNRPSDVAWEDGVLYIMDSGNSALRSMEFDPWKWLEGLGE